MKILYSHYQTTLDCPAGQMILAVADELRSLGHEVAVHSSEGEPTPATASVNRPAKRFTRLRARLWFAKAIARDTRRIKHDAAAIVRFAPDVILARQDAYCSSMAVAGHRLGVPVVTYADAPAACEARQRNDAGRWHPRGLVEMIERRVLRRSAAVVTISEPAAEVLRGYGLPVPIHAVPNGIDPKRYLRLEGDARSAERRSLGLTAERVIGFQGTFQSFHGLERLRELMLSTVGRTDTQWLLIGDGPGRADLERTVAGKVNAVFLGRVPSERMGSLLGLIDVGVAPYSHVPGVFYGCPLKVLEYAAAGCAILASGQGDVAALLDGGRAGVVIDRDDSALWIQELNRLLNEPERCEAFGRAGREWIHSHYTWRTTATRIDEILKDVLRRSGHKVERNVPRNVRGKFPMVAISR